MPRDVITSWLLALADPTGLSEALPARSLARANLPELWQMADRHGVLGTVFANFRTALARSEPRRIVSDCLSQGQSDGGLAAEVACARRRLRSRAAQALVIRTHASLLVPELSANGVPACILKGPDFADRLYPDPSLRAFGDIDLLVPQSAADKAGRLLTRLGYRPRSSQMKYDSGYGERSFINRDKAKVLVELHWNLVNSPTLRRGVSVNFNDLQLLPPCNGDRWPLRPSPASLLLIAAVHGAAGHAFDRLQWVCDICQAARQRADQIDTEWLRRAIKRTGSRLSLSLGLALAGRMLHEPKCARLADMLGLPRALMARCLVTPKVVLRCHEGADSWRRQAFRELLKRTG